jgi:hypothetical protein
MTRSEWKQAIKNKVLLDWKLYHKARSHFPPKENIQKRSLALKMETL